MRKIIWVLGISSLSGSGVAEGGVSCFTWSNQILFKATGKLEEKTLAAVVNGCIRHDYTDPIECKEHARCFPENEIVDLDGTIAAF